MVDKWYLYFISEETEGQEVFVAFTLLKSHHYLFLMQDYLSKLVLQPLTYVSTRRVYGRLVYNLQA